MKESARRVLRSFLVFVVSMYIVMMVGLMLFLLNTVVTQLLNGPRFLNLGGP